MKSNDFNNTFSAVWLRRSLFHLIKERYKGN